MKKFMVSLGMLLRYAHIVLIVGFISGTIGILFLNIQENFPTWYLLHMSGSILFFLLQFLPMDGKIGRCPITVWEQRIWKQYDPKRHYTGGLWPTLLGKFTKISIPNWFVKAIGLIVSLPTLFLLPEFLNL